MLPLFALLWLLMKTKDTQHHFTSVPLYFLIATDRHEHDNVSLLIRLGLIFYPLFLLTVHGIGSYFLKCLTLDVYITLLLGQLYNKEYFCVLAFHPHSIRMHDFPL